MSKPRYAVATDDKGRFYAHPQTGETWISITNALDMAVSKPALVPWAAKVTANALWDRLPEAVKASMGGTVLDGRGREVRHSEQLLREVKAQVKYVKDSAADLGTRVHDAAEHLALGTVAPEDEEAAPYAEQVLRWAERFGLNMAADVEAAEATVINRTCSYAGTGDLWAWLKLAPDGTWTPRKKHLWLIDYKSSSTRPADSTYIEYGMQLAALAMGEHLLLDDGSEIPAPGPIAGCAVLNLRRNAYAFIPMAQNREAAYEAFCAAVQVATYLHSNTTKAPVVDGPPVKASA